MISSRTRISPSRSFPPNTDALNKTKTTVNGAPAMSARTFKGSPKPTSKVTPRVTGAGGGPTWSMTPLMEVLPGSSPPPVGSSGSSPLSSKTCSPKSEKSFFSDLDASTPRNQEWLENAKEVSHFGLPSLLNNPHKGSCLSKLAMVETAVSDPQHESPKRQSNSEREDYEDFNHIARGNQSTNEDSDGGISPIAGRDRLMERPKPYHEFLDEVKKQELQAEIEAWRKAERMKLMTKLREEEAAIEEWEYKQTSKALKDIKRLETKLEKKRVKAVENTWKTINMTKEEANRKKIRARQSTIGKLSSVSETSHRSNSSAKTIMWHKLTGYCKSMYFKSVRCKAPAAIESKRSLE